MRRRVDVGGVESKPAPFENQKCAAPKCSLDGGRRGVAAEVVKAGEMPALPRVAARPVRGSKPRPYKPKDKGACNYRR